MKAPRSWIDCLDEMDTHRHNIRAVAALMEGHEIREGLDGVLGDTADLILSELEAMRVAGERLREELGKGARR